MENNELNDYQNEMNEKLKNLEQEFLKLNEKKNKPVNHRQRRKMAREMGLLKNKNKNQKTYIETIERSIKAGKVLHDIHRKNTEDSLEYQRLQRIENVKNDLRSRNWTEEEIESHILKNEQINEKRKNKNRNK